MDLKGIVSISGMNGLYKSVTQRGDGMIATSLETKETKFIPSRTHQFSALEGIAIYTDDGESKELKEIFPEMLKKEVTNPLPDSSAGNDALKKYFKAVLPNYDEEKVYVSDIRKVIKWYSALKKENMIIAKEQKSEEKQESAVK